MQRPIEYRAWDIQAKIMRRVTAIMFVGEGIPLVLQEDNYNFAGELMQYTGLCDKNGTKIFEGDIVKSGKLGRPLEVKWGNIIGDHPAEDFILAIGFDTFLADDPTNTSPGAYEVIGNVFQNPDLIQGVTNAR